MLKTYICVRSQGDYRNHFPFYMTSNRTVFTATEVAKSLRKWTEIPRNPEESRKCSPLFSLLTFPQVRSASQFKGDVLAGQGGFMLLDALEAVPPPTAIGSSTEGFCWSTVPRVGFSPAKEVCV